MASSIPSNGNAIMTIIPGHGRSRRPMGEPFTMSWRFVLCPPRSTESLTCNLAVPIGTVREPSEKTLSGGILLR